MKVNLLLLLILIFAFQCNPRETLSKKKENSKVIEYDICGLNYDRKVFLGETYDSISFRLNHNLNVDDWWSNSTEIQGFFLDTIINQTDTIKQIINLTFNDNSLNKVIVENYSSNDSINLLFPFTSCKSLYKYVNNDNFTQIDTSLSVPNEDKTIHIKIRTSLHPQRGKGVYVSYQSE